MTRVRVSDEIALEQVSSNYHLEFLELCRHIDIEKMEYCPEIVSSCIDEKSAKFLLDDYYTKFQETKAPDMFIFLNGHIIGIIGYAPELNEQGVGELGFWVAPHFQRKGIASRCIPSMLSVGKETMGLSKVELLIKAENMKSIELARKLGFTQGLNRFEDEREYCLFSYDLK
jgi:ribosomal-protein-serine acetyltransferase